MNREALIQDIFNLVNSHEKGDNNNFKKMDKIFSKGITVYECLSSGSFSRPIMIYALDRKKNDVVSYLLKKGGDPLQRDSHGYNLLHNIAIKSGSLVTEDSKNHFELFKSIIESSESSVELIKSTALCGSTVLHKFMSVDFGNLELIKYCLENGADINALDKRGDTPLSCTITKVRNAALLNDYINLDSIEILLEKGADINIKNNNGISFADTVDELKEDFNKDSLRKLLKLVEYRTTAAIEIRVNNNHKNKIKTHMRNRSKIGGVKI